MGLLDRVADLVARLFVTAPDHPGQGGLTGDTDREENGDEGESTTERE
ncbi:MAG: hypothetical protein ABEH56_08930 [Salinirussus sp.]